MKKDIKSWRSGLPQDTTKIALELSKTLQPGDILLLDGDLGSGKTFLVQEICKAWRVTEAVTSPTFTLMHHYHGHHAVNHLDLYRIENRDELIQLGWEDALFSDAISFVEWPQLLEDQLTEYYKISISFEDNYRNFLFVKHNTSL